MKKIIFIIVSVLTSSVGFSQGPPTLPHWSTTGNSNVNPAINFLGTIDAKDLVIKTNNIERMKVLGAGPLSGNVKIGGGTIPKQKLDVQGNIAISGGIGELVFDGPDGFIDWGHATAGDLNFRVMNFQGNLSQGTVTRMKLEGATGNLGIDGNISVKGTHMVFNSQHGVIDWGNSGFGDLYFRTLSTQGDINTYTDRMVLTKEGRLGIGTFGLPATQTLEVNGSAFVNKENEGFLVDAGSGGGRVGLMKYQGHEGVISRVAGQDFGITRTSSSNIKDPTNLEYDFYINGGGAIGIGTLSPQSKLHVATPASNTTGGFIIDHNYTGPGSYAQVTTVNNDLTRALAIYKMTGSNAALVFQVLGNGKTRIGFDTQTGGPHTDAMLTVGGTSGKLVAKQIFVTNSNWADYVFAADYKVPDLYDVEAYYKANKHLPEIPSENEVKENGINVGEMNVLLLKKIEEMTIILVKQQREIDDLKKKINN